MRRPSLHNIALAALYVLSCVAVAATLFAWAELTRMWTGGGWLGAGVFFAPFLAVWVLLAAYAVEGVR